MYFNLRMYFLYLHRISTEYENPTPNLPDEQLWFHSILQKLF